MTEQASVTESGNNNSNASVEDKSLSPEMTPDQLKTIIEENNRLKSFHDKVLQEKKAEEDKARQAKAEAEKAKLEAEGNVKELLALKDKEHQEEILELKKLIEEYNSKEKRSKVQQVANELANELAKSHAGRAKTLAEKLATRLTLTEDGVKVTDDKGNILGSKFDVLKDFARNEYDFLCDGVQSTGSAGVKAVQPTDSQSMKNKLSPVDRINRSRGVKLM